jgi:hypothetical protein
MFDAATIDLHNLPPELDRMVQTLLIVSREGCTDVGELMRRLYGNVTDYTPKQQDECCTQYARILMKMYGCKWITAPDAEFVALTAAGVEAADTMREFYRNNP